MSKVMVVDDEPDIRRLVSFALKRHGYEVVEAEDGLAAVALAEREMPDLILMDVMMPVMNGYEASQKLRENEGTSRIPIVMLSAKSQATEVQAGLESGATRYICKPFTPKDLVAEVTKYVKADAQAGQADSAIGAGPRPDR